MLQNATVLRKSAPSWHVWWRCFLYCPCQQNANCKMHFCGFSSNVPHLPLFSKLLQNFHVWLTFPRCRIHCACHEKWCLNVQKWSERGVFSDIFSRQPRALFEQHNFQKLSGVEVLLTFWLRNALGAAAAYIFWTTQLPKVLRNWSVLASLTSKFASCHSRAHFLSNATSKSAPVLMCFWHFDFEMRFTLQPHVHFFSSSTGKNVPEVKCFQHF